MSKSIISATIVVAILTASQLVAAQTQVSDSTEFGAETHDGFFLRLSTGFGVAPNSGVAEHDDLHIDGPAHVGDVAVGWAVADNLILHAEFTSVQVLGNSGTLDNEKDYETLNLDGLGVGVTYYVMPANIYVSGSVSAVGGYFAEEDSFDTGSHSVGFGTNAMVGKEWWVSDNWGLGVAGTVGYTRIRMDEDDEHRNITSYGVLFSATYN